MLVNKTRKKKIIDKVKIARTQFEQARGLMFRKKPDYALVFPKREASRFGISIHMLFVFFPIDVVYLNKNKVVDVRRNVLPFTPFLMPKAPADTLIELPAGKAKGVRAGDAMLWDQTILI